MKYKNLFIDLDDTLWDTFHNNTECLKEIYAAYDFEPHYPTFEAFFDRYWPHNNRLWEQYRDGEISRQTLIVERFRHMLAPLGIKDDASSLKLNEHFLQLTKNKTKLVPHALEVCKYLKSKYRLFILSNGFREVQSQKLDNSGLTPYFEKVILSEDAHIQKPNREIFRYALKTTNSRLNESLMIGDSWDADIVGGKNAGMDQLWFNPYKFPHEGFDPTFMVDSLLDIKEIL